MNIASELTICTVSYGHARFLRLGHELLMRLNTGNRANPTWLVAENEPPGAPDRVDPHDTRYDMVSVQADASQGASHHHATALNELLRHVRTRFLLVLDPDMFLLFPEWIESVLNHMHEHQLAFFGVPWHPKYSNNYRYFPAVHCMFVDLGRVDTSKLDFRPILDVRDHPSYSRLGRFLFGPRWRIPSDTGTRVFQTFAHQSGIRSECVAPVLRMPEDWLGDAPTLKSKLMDVFLPDRLCYFPKRQRSYTSIGFAERGYGLPELPRLWEQFIWKNQPFCLHVRGSFNASNRDREREFELLLQAISALTSSSHPGSDTLSH